MLAPDSLANPEGGHKVLSCDQYPLFNKPPKNSKIKTTTPFYGIHRRGLSQRKFWPLVVGFEGGRKGCQA